VRLEGLGQLKNSITSSGVEPATFRLSTTIQTVWGNAECRLLDIKTDVSKTELTQSKIHFFGIFLPFITILGAHGSVVG
jgi:hypothetical protein